MVLSDPLFPALREDRLDSSLLAIITLPATDHHGPSNWSDLSVSSSPPSACAAEEGLNL
jgi:hypothetical protein